VHDLSLLPGHDDIICGGKFDSWIAILPIRAGKTIAAVANAPECAIADGRHGRECVRGILSITQLI